MNTMTSYQAFVLGVVQGTTELLPISSSAHLNLIPWVMGWNIPDSFDVALHFGTLLAIGIFFFKDWIELIKGGYKYVVKKEKTVQGRMFWYIVIATIPGGIIGFLLDHFLGDNLNQPLIISLAPFILIFSLCTNSLAVPTEITLYLSSVSNTCLLYSSSFSLKLFFKLYISSNVFFSLSIIGERIGVESSILRANVDPSIDLYTLVKLYIKNSAININTYISTNQISYLKSLIQIP